MSYQIRPMVHPTQYLVSSSGNSRCSSLKACKPPHSPLSTPSHFPSTHSAGLGFVWWVYCVLFCFKQGLLKGTLPCYSHQFRNLMHVNTYLNFLFHAANIMCLLMLLSHEVPKARCWMRTVFSLIHPELIC